MQGCTLKEVIGVAVYKIRFPLMTHTEMIKVKESGILTSMLLASFRAIDERKLCKLQLAQQPGYIFSRAPRRNVCNCKKGHRNCACWLTVTPKINKQNKCPVCLKPTCKKWINSELQRCECIKYECCPEFTGKFYKPKDSSRPAGQ